MNGVDGSRGVPPVMCGESASTENDRQLLAALRAAAMDYAAEEWPIVALNQSGDHLVAGMSPRSPRMAADWWSERPYGIGVRVGERFDVLEIPSAAGELVRAQLRMPAPMFDVPLRGWFVLVSAGAPRITELAPYRRIIHMHRRGTWLPLPPTRLAGGPALWVSRGAIPHSLIIQASLLPIMRHVLPDTTGGLSVRSSKR